MAPCLATYTATATSLSSCRPTSTGCSAASSSSPWRWRARRPCPCPTRQPASSRWAGTRGPPTRAATRKNRSLTAAAPETWISRWVTCPLPALPPRTFPSAPTRSAPSRCTRTSWRTWSMLTAAATRRPRASRTMAPMRSTRCSRSARRPRLARSPTRRAACFRATAASTTRGSRRTRSWAALWQTCPPLLTTFSATCTPRCWRRASSLPPRSTARSGHAS
mmetsp:Transcript_14172/g.36181  ORF Transcript_14172/g.36181 Transcript_14172/m.36181 type:complete len:221 (-) Transcript_14172:3071-3733(-)